MYNFYESFEKIKFKEWIFLNFNCAFVCTLRGVRVGSDRGSGSDLNQTATVVFAICLKKYWVHFIHIKCRAV